MAIQQYVAFRGYNGREFYGHKMVLCPEDQAEYKIVLHGADELKETQEGACLLVGKLIYWQCEEMKTFKGVVFNPDPRYAASGVNLPVLVRKIIRVK